MTADTESLVRPAPRPRARRKWPRLTRPVVIALAVGAVGVLLARVVVPRPLVVDVAVVDRGPLDVTVEGEGQTRVKDRQHVSAPLDGELAKVELDPGDVVHQGDVVATMVPAAPPLLDARSKALASARLSIAQAAWQRASSEAEQSKVALAQADQDYEHAKALAEGGAISQNELDRATFARQSRQEALRSARFASQVAAHEVDAARAALGILDRGGREEPVAVQSPVDGVVLARENDGDAVVAAGTPIVEIGDPSALEIVVDVLSTDAVRVAPGDPVTIERWGGPGLLAAHVDHVEPKAFTRVSALGVEEQRVNVVVDLDEPPERWSTLGDGWRVEASIRVARVDEAVRVPIGATFRQDGGQAVYRVEDGVVRVVPIDVGERSDAFVDATSGVSPGDAVVVYPSDLVREGVRVVAR